MDPNLRFQILDAFNHYEGVTAIFDGGYSQERIRSIHANNKSAVFGSPYQVVENLSEGVIVINAFGGNESDLHNYFENVFLVGAGHPTLKSQIDSFINKYELDLGDYIDDNGLVFKPNSSQDCLLCDIFKSDLEVRRALEENDQLRATPSLMNIVLYESSHFYVVPAKGALVKGYVMIVPKEHHLSFAALPEGELSEALQVLEDIKGLFGKVYNTTEFVVFEHGTGPNGSKHEKAIVHAHLHVLPYTPVVTPETAIKFHLSPLDIDKISEFSKVPYLLYTDSQLDWHISADPDVYIPRQCIRQLIGDTLKLDGQLWNWRRHSCMREIQDMVYDYHRYLQDHFFSLDPHISQATSGFMLQMNRK